MKPVKRSKLRIVGGRIYHRLRREVEWHFSAKRFAKGQGDAAALPVVLFQHQTPLFRDLPKVDQWLQLNKIENLKIAIKKMDRLVIAPGAIFSFWFLVGQPTKARGYRTGFILKDGKIALGTGGGLCQLSNLIYWMALHSPLTVLERWRHSHDVFPDNNRVLPFGSGATCAYPALDLQIKNTTPHPVQLVLSLSDSHLTGEWRGLQPWECSYQVQEAFHEIITDFKGSYIRHNILRRKVFNTARIQMAEEFITENWAFMMYQPLLPEQSAPVKAEAGLS